MLSPKAEALFPGRRLPAREKSIVSVTSVSPWFTLINLTGSQLPSPSHKTKVTAETSVVMEMAAVARSASPAISEAIT